MKYIGARKERERDFHLRCISLYEQSWAVAAADQTVLADCVRRRVTWESVLPTLPGKPTLKT